MVGSIVEILNIACMSLPARARLMICAQVQAWTDGMRAAALAELAEREEPRAPARPYVDAQGWSPRNCPGGPMGRR